MLLMLNTDMSMVYPIETNSTIISNPRFKQICGPNTPKKGHFGCTGERPKAKRPLKDTLSLCKHYAANNAAFVKAFGKAFTRMTTVGYGIAPAPNNNNNNPNTNGRNSSIPGPVAGRAAGTGKLGTLTPIDLSAC
jgi:hypothetical protein